MKILFAEDEDDLRDVVSEYLRYQGYHVTAVNNGALALEKAQTDAYDAMVFDVMMPVMDGITAMKKIRELGDTTPAIFLTAKSQVEDRIEGLDAAFQMENPIRESRQGLRETGVKMIGVDLEVEAQVGRHPFHEEGEDLPGVFTGRVEAPVEKLELA